MSLHFNILFSFFAVDPKFARLCMPIVSIMLDSAVSLNLTIINFILDYCRVVDDRSCYNRFLSSWKLAILDFHGLVELNVSHIRVVVGVGVVVPVGGGIDLIPWEWGDVAAGCASVGEIGLLAPVIEV